MLLGDDEEVIFGTKKPADGLRCKYVNDPEVQLLVKVRCVWIG
jgi:hypothetical protein